MLVDTYHEDNFDFILRTKKTTRKLKTFTQQDRIDIEQHNKDCKIIELEKAKDIQKTKQGSWSHMDDLNFNCNYIFDTKIDNPMDSDNDEDDIKAKILKNFSKTKIVTPKVIILSKTPVIKKAVIVDDVDKVFLFVPFQFKDDAKKNGAKWDLIHKKWYTYLADEYFYHNLVDTFHIDNFEKLTFNTYCYKSKFISFEEHKQKLALR